MHAASQHVEPTALAEFQLYHPSSTRFPPSYKWINEISWYYCEKISCDEASAIEHVQQAFAQHVEPTALAEIQLSHPSSTRFRPSYIWINEKLLCYCGKVSCDVASLTLWVQHVHARCFTTCRTDSAGSITTLPPVQYSIPSVLYIDKRDVVVLLWKSQLWRSFSDRTRPTSLCTTCGTDSAGSFSTLSPVQFSNPSFLYIYKRDVVVVLWKSQLWRSFGDFMGPTRPCTLLFNM
jgi:hypothetical protein